MSIYKDCDIRGIYGKELCAEHAYTAGRALATLAPGEILLGGDVRLSTPELKAALEKGLMDGGASVVDLGTIPTPVLYFALKHSQASAGATVTASHNPPEYNGIKFMIGDTPVTRELMDKIKDIIRAGAYSAGDGTRREWDVTKTYMDHLCERFSAKKPLHVLVDAGCGAMSRIAPEVFKRVGYRVTELSCTPDGAFPDRSPNPSDYKNLNKTSDMMRKVGADLGVAFDGDGDRAVFLDETGAPVQNEKSLVLFIRSLLKDAPSCVVYDQKSSSVVREAIEEMHGTPLPERSGHAFIKRRFLLNHAALAGEVSGHFFFGELGYDDGLFAALMMAELIESSGRTLHELANAITCPPITPDLRFFCPYAQQQHWLECARSYALSNGGTLSYVDGVRADFDGAWFLMRSSVTAEQLTLRAEAQSEEKLRELLISLAQALPEGASALIDRYLEQ